MVDGRKLQNRRKLRRWFRRNKQVIRHKHYDGTVTHYLANRQNWFTWSTIKLTARQLPLTEIRQSFFHPAS